VIPAAVSRPIPGVGVQVQGWHACQGRAAHQLIANLGYIPNFQSLSSQPASTKPEP
jgi:hypothetical protein